LLSGLWFWGSKFTQVAVFDHSITLDNLWHRHCPLSQGKTFVEGVKGDAIGKSHKIVKTRLESCCMGPFGSCGRAASFPFAVFFF
jgi:hypothetical protein